MRTPYKTFLQIFTWFKNLFKKNCNLSRYDKISVYLLKFAKDYPCLCDETGFLSENLRYFLDSRVFQKDLKRKVFALSLSFSEKHLPPSLFEAYSAVQSFLNFLQIERSYFVIEGSFSEIDQRPNVHLLFTLKNSPHLNDCQVAETGYCLECKEYFLKFWKKGTIFLSFLTEENRNKIIPYFAKITKEKKKNNNFPLLCDYWERVFFSEQFSSLYQKGLVSQLRKHGLLVKSKQDRKIQNISTDFSRDRKDYRRSYWSSNKEWINVRRREKYKHKKTKFSKLERKG